MHERAMSERCESHHRHAGCRCIRARGHEGLCWSGMERSASNELVRCQWYSRDGKFKSHHSYPYGSPSTVNPEGASVE